MIAIKVVKNLIISILIVQLLFVSSISFADTGSKKIAEDCTFILPASLMSIEEEAFGGTAVERVVFPDGFMKLGGQAFENAPNMKDVYIPETTVYIAGDSFPLSTNMTIHGVENSFVHQWAADNGVAFVVDDIWTKAQASFGFHVESLFVLLFVVCPVDEEHLKRFLLDAGEYLRSMRPQDRPELNPIDFRFP